MTHWPTLMEDFLLRNGWTITDPGPGARRLAVRGHLRFELGPRCRCEYCPPHVHPNYVREAV